MPKENYATEEVMQGEIPVELTNIQVELEEQSMIIEQLYKKLMPILSTASAQKDSLATPPTPFGSELGGRIGNIRESIKTNNRKIRDILKSAAL